LRSVPRGGGSPSFFSSAPSTSIVLILFLSKRKSATSGQRKSYVVMYRNIKDSSGLRNRFYTVRIDSHCWRHVTILSLWLLNYHSGLKTKNKIKILSMYYTYYVLH
jgi:hypothetical protein